MLSNFPNRPIRSFVRRDSRITPAQKIALEQNWDRYALPGCCSHDDFIAAFGRDAPITLEIGSGDGACVRALAAANPDEDFVAVEVYRPGLGRLIHEAAADHLQNIRVFDDDVCDLLARLSGPVFNRILVFFPDPWPKKRHHKRRLLQSGFFDLLVPRLHRHGRVFIATDCADYAESMIDVIEGLENWVNLAGPRRISLRPRFRPVTKFERKAMDAGTAIYDLTLALR